MKRCPQCEFIYEDEQSLCDMDGALLVFDARTLPNVALAPVDMPIIEAAPRAHWRHRTFPAVAALILASVFSLVYFVSTQRRVPAPAAVSGATIAVPAAALPSPSDTNQIVLPPAAEIKEEPKPEPGKTITVAPVKKTSSKTTSATTTPATERKSAEPKKDDSKVGSILKKTGRILKKPFKF
jgi:hypothetical protein